MSSDKSATGEQQNDELPFNCEWEVGVQEAGNEDEWAWAHPMAKSEQEARRKARNMAESGNVRGQSAPYHDAVVYDVSGPYRPNDPIRVGEEMIEEVFG